MNVGELIESSAGLCDDTAVLGVRSDSGQSYAELRVRVRACRHLLRSHGVGPADIVLVSIPNGPECLVATLGVMSAAICAPMNPAYTEEELAGLAEDLRPKAIVVGPSDEGPAVRLAASKEFVLIRFSLEAAVDADDPDLEEGPDEDAIALILHTAGTTARPKQVPLSYGNLVAAARNVVASLNLTPEDRCLNVMPLFHSHGLLGAALSTLASGGSIVCTPGMDPRYFFQWAERFECTWYTAASTVHRLVLDAPGSWGGFRFMRSASGPLPPQLARELEARCGAPMIEVFGMTEAYQIAANPLPPGKRRFGSVGRATGTEISILGPDGVVLTEGQGEILVRGAAVFKGYLAPANANDQAFVDGWFRTGDLGILGSDRYLTITGRLKEQINRAGEKISPREVEEVVLDYPGVVEAVAFGVPDPMLGKDIVLAVVLAPGVSLDLPSLRTQLGSRLASYKVPRRLLVVESIPKSDTGKPQRNLLSDEFVAGRFGAVPTVETDAPSQPRTVEEQLARIWVAVLHLAKPPRSEDRFFDLGGDSLAVMELVAAVEEDFGVDLPLLQVHQVPSLGELARHIEGRSVTESSDSLLVRYREGATDSNVMLIPGQFGLAVGLDLIADAIGEGPTIYLYDYPGHRFGERPASSIEEIAAALVGAIDDLGVRGRLVLYGNSMGGWVALEAARVLAARGRGPELVGIGDMFSPTFNVDRAGVRPRLHRRAVNVLGRVARRLRPLWRVTRRGGDVASLAERRRAAVSTASEIARRAYRPHPYNGGLLVVSTAPRAAKFGESLGYERHVTGRIRTIRVAGGHSEMHREQATVIGGALAEHLTGERSERVTECE